MLSSEPRLDGVEKMPPRLARPGGVRELGLSAPRAQLFTRDQHQLRFAERFPAPLADAALDVHPLQFDFLAAGHAVIPPLLVFDSRGAGYFLAALETELFHRGNRRRHCITLQSQSRPPVQTSRPKTKCAV